MGTVESRLQSLQYKIINRISYHNYLIHKYGYIDSNKCDNCNMVETIEHKYYECNHIKQFWKDFATWWNAHFNDSIILSLDCIIFGYLVKTNIPLNYCIILGKYYINYMYQSSKSNNISVRNFLACLKRKLEILEFTYIIKDQTEKFQYIFEEPCSSL